MRIHRSFEVVAWVPEKQMGEARYAVRSEARRLVMTGAWGVEETYDVSSSVR